MKLWSFCFEQKCNSSVTYMALKPSSCLLPQLKKLVGKVIEADAFATKRSSGVTLKGESRESTLVLEPKVVRSREVPPKKISKTFSKSSIHILEFNRFSDSHSLLDGVNRAVDSGQLLLGLFSCRLCISCENSEDASWKLGNLVFLFCLIGKSL